MEKEEEIGKLERIIEILEGGLEYLHRELWLMKERQNSGKRDGSDK